MINQEEYHSYCLALPHTEACFPFNESTLVFKVHGKMFALGDIENWSFLNLKCDPIKAEELRVENEGIKPAYHINKKHWNSVDVKGKVSRKEIFELIDHSYKLVFASLPKKLRDIK